MSSWHDKTRLIIKRLAAEQAPPAMWADIMLARLSQVEAYFREARKDPASGLRGDFAFAHPGLTAWAERTGISKGGDVFETMREVIAWAGKHGSAGILYAWSAETQTRLPLAEIIADLFERCHDLGHALARSSRMEWSDNPFPYVLKRKRYPGKQRAAVLDSDAYIREHYGEFWGRVNGR